jgi:hypothetical protein
MFIRRNPRWAAELMHRTRTSSWRRDEKQSTAILMPDAIRLLPGLIYGIDPKCWRGEGWVGSGPALLLSATLMPARMAILDREIRLIASTGI